MTTRRQFLATGAAMGLLAATRGRATTACPADCSITEFEARIAKRDFRGMTKDILPTPCLVVDLDMFRPT